MQDAVTPGTAAGSNSFFDEPGVQVEEIPVGPGVPLGIETVSNPGVGIGGAYGAWGDAYDNAALPELLKECWGRELQESEIMNLADLGFVSRHHVPDLPDELQTDLEVQVGARFVIEAAHANGWEPGEVEGLLLGVTLPVVPDYTERVARLAGIPESALMVSVHKACDGSVAGLNLALNPNLPSTLGAASAVAERLYGKRVLIGGIEGLSRTLRASQDMQAQQLFGSAAGVIGVIPGKTMKFIVGGSQEVYDQEGLLQVHMYYPHARQFSPDAPLIDVTVADNHIRVAGFQHEPAAPTRTVMMAGPMGMVKLFVRNGVVGVRGVMESYRRRMGELGMPGKDITIAIAHHANLKINQLKDRYLQKEGVHLNIPWLLTEFGNVSAASCMIAFLRALQRLSPGDHVLFDGFGAGTYYDVLVVELGSGS
jgi:3-oxoacyl-[acyl-carrier-protein] synthase III